MRSTFRLQFWIEVQRGLELNYHVCNANSLYLFVTMAKTTLGRCAGCEEELAWQVAQRLAHCHGWSRDYFQVLDVVRPLLLAASFFLCPRLQGPLRPAVSGSRSSSFLTLCFSSSLARSLSVFSIKLCSSSGFPSSYTQAHPSFSCSCRLFLLCFPFLFRFFSY